MMVIPLRVHFYNRYVNYEFNNYGTYLEIEIDRYVLRDDFYLFKNILPLKKLNKYALVNLLKLIKQNYQNCLDYFFKKGNLQIMDSLLIQYIYYL